MENETIEPMTLKRKGITTILVCIMIIVVIGSYLLVSPFIFPSDSDSYEFDTESLYMKTGSSYIFSGMNIYVHINDVPIGQYILRIVDIEQEIDCSEPIRFNVTRTTLDMTCRIKVIADHRAICMIKLVEWNEYLIDYLFIQVFHVEG